jgi:hypothetical protein
MKTRSQRSSTKLIGSRRRTKTTTKALLVDGKLTTFGRKAADTGELEYQDLCDRFEGKTHLSKGRPAAVKAKLALDTSKSHTGDGPYHNVLPTVLDCAGINEVQETNSESVHTYVVTRLERTRLKRKKTVNVSTSKQPKRQTGSVLKHTQDPRAPAAGEDVPKSKGASPVKTTNCNESNNVVPENSKHKENPKKEKSPKKTKSRRNKKSKVLRCRILQLLARYKYNHDEVHSSVMDNDIPEGEYEVEQILCNQDDVYVLVKWRVDPCPTWEPFSSFQQEIIHYYESQGRVDLREYDAVLNATR